MYFRGCLSDIASSYLFRPSKVWKDVTSRVSGGEFKIKKRNLTLTLNLLVPSIVFHNNICVLIMIFTDLSFYALFTAYFLHEEVMSVTLYVRSIQKNISNWHDIKISAELHLKSIDMVFKW